MRHFLIALFALVFVARPVWADTSLTHEVTNVKEYENCAVGTSVDMFTDAVSHALFCHEETLTDKTVISLRYGAARTLDVLFSKGLQFHADERIPVAFRIDKGPLIRKTALWDKKGGQLAQIPHDQPFAHSLLTDLAHGQRIAIQVGEESGHIILKGSRQAVADFRQRIGHHAQQTLTIEPRTP